MEIRKYIDKYGDDVFALALIVTKDFDKAGQAFAVTAEHYAEIPEDGLFDAVSRTYAYCRECGSNDEAQTLTGVELSSKQEPILKSVLTKPQIVRAIIHLYYENDLDAARIAAITGESERYIKKQLEELSKPLSDALDKHYKEICVKIRAADSLKAYAVRASEKKSKRAFEPETDAVPLHRWTKAQKAVVIVIAAIVTVMVCIVIPLAQAYREMRKEEGNKSYDEVPTDEMFSYTLEVGSDETDPVNSP